jgi:hypothetical protein
MFCYKKKLVNLQAQSHSVPSKVLCLFNLFTSAFLVFLTPYFCPTRPKLSMCHWHSSKSFVLLFYFCLYLELKNSHVPIHFLQCQTLRPVPSNSQVIQQFAEWYSASLFHSQDNFFPGFTLITMKHGERTVIWIHIQVIFGSTLTNFQVDIVFYKECCFEITVVWTIRKFKTTGGKHNRISISNNAYLSTRGSLTDLFLAVTSSEQNF